MEFLDYNQTLEEAKTFGVIERPQGEDRMRFDLTHTPPHTTEAQAVVFAPEGQAPQDEPASRVVTCPRDQLAELVDTIIHKVHLNQVALIPAQNWGGIVNLVAFDLATEEAWNDIDAEASLHKNTRNPLMIESQHMHLVKKFIAALLEHGDSPEHDLSIVALGAPLVIELIHPGALRVACGSPAVADNLASAV